MKTHAAGFILKDFSMGKKDLQSHSRTLGFVSLNRRFVFCEPVNNSEQGISGVYL